MLLFIMFFDELDLRYTFPKIHLLNILRMINMEFADKRTTTACQDSNSYLTPKMAGNVIAESLNLCANPQAGVT